MKRLLTFLLLFIISAILPFGCSSNNANTPGISSGSEKVLSIYNYSTYVAPEVIAQFEKENNVKIKYDTYDNSDALYAKLKQGNPGYDLVFPADYMVKIMVSENMLEPLNLEKIPNQKNLDPKFVKQSFDPDNKYSFPYQWGTMGIGYNLKATKTEINSWEAMFDPKFTGKVAWQDDARYTFSGVLMYLGYNPNTTNPDEINKARDLLIKNKAMIAAFVPDTGQNLLAQGEVNLTMEWSGDIFQVMTENPDLRFAIPKEGTIVFTDNIAIPKDAPNKELAEKFINFVLQPEIGAKISNFIHFGSPNKAAIDQGLIDEKDRKNPQIYPPNEIFSKLKYIEDIGKATALYDRAWTEVKAAFGK
ncbi:spermidine/putrescine ABC transporter substrate-binding protein [Kamptonema sp. UHCC 0994]|uniref:ABC transporter substrate-binding protein n=1 Tax=Kamptonema sp. UHCC 0994 TaxID=3031329 RepID=UPI0023BAA74A|nr:spermidine/putrescine ABC transporter substrate-binding protein [Kamptonema sp. UHCC 0994]MDF0556489.1 spermidine/putrescine ABC transporter substrate-binding protein [Kamptonema sp. UHCC 0994]